MGLGFLRSDFTQPAFTPAVPTTFRFPHPTIPHLRCSDLDTHTPAVYTTPAHQLFPCSYTPTTTSSPSTVHCFYHHPLPAYLPALPLPFTFATQVPCLHSYDTCLLLLPYTTTMHTHRHTHTRTILCSTTVSTTHVLPHTPWWVLHATCTHCCLPLHLHYLVPMLYHYHGATLVNSFT